MWKLKCDFQFTSFPAVIWKSWAEFDFDFISVRISSWKLIWLWVFDEFEKKIKLRSNLSHQPQRNFSFRSRNANSAHLWWFRIKKSLRTQTSHRSHYIFTLHESTVPFATSARVKIVQTLFGDVAKHSFRSWMESKAFHFASLLFPQWNEHVKAFSVNPMAVNERRKKCKQHVITLGFMRDTLRAQGG